ncbi:hypothetical protein AKJ09_03203 [Labilithrix luteola]|uniref:Uncharacterized protein n=1 Tax=Labilithrix luteola TaxID=1391654 RepID=A0A0K1PTT0_9BACT|nr:hypothetical protein AKJ09_03203 [Labilithrix luteola]
MRLRAERSTASMLTRAQTKRRSFDFASRRFVHSVVQNLTVAANAI